MESPPSSSPLLLRVSAVVFALAMLAVFVWYSQMNAQTTVPMVAKEAPAQRVEQKASALMLSSKAALVDVVPNQKVNELVFVVPDSPKAPVTPSPQGYEKQESSGVSGSTIVLDGLGLQKTNRAILEAILGGPIEEYWWLHEVSVSGNALAPTFVEVMGRKTSVGRFAPLPTVLDSGMSLNLPMTKVEEVQLEEVQEPMLMASSKVGPIFPAYRMRIVHRSKVKATNVVPSSAEYIREAIEHLGLFNTTVSTTKP